MCLRNSYELKRHDEAVKVDERKDGIWQRWTGACEYIMAKEGAIAQGSGQGANVFDS